MQQRLKPFQYMARKVYREIESLESHFYLPTELISNHLISKLTEAYVVID